MGVSVLGSLGFGGVVLVAARGWIGLDLRTEEEENLEAIIGSLKTWCTSILLLRNDHEEEIPRYLTSVIASFTICGNCELHIVRLYFPSLKHLHTANWEEL
ncbi:hypothetical protein AAG906_006715 [Vitis piasezkii]